MSGEEVSLRNSEKLDRVVFLLEGGGKGAPGIVETVAVHDELLLGRQGKNGLAHKVNIMWRAHVWILCSLSGLMGFVLKMAFEKFVKP